MVLAGTPQPPVETENLNSREMRDRMMDKWQTRWAKQHYRKLDKKTYSKPDEFGKEETRDHLAQVLT